MWKDAFWLKLPQEELEEKRILSGDMTGRFAFFRCEVNACEGARLTADISANSRYRLWVNGRPVLSGPCKGDTFRQYYETVDLGKYLHPGKNTVCAQVLYQDPYAVERQTEERAAIYGVISHPCGHRFAMEGDITDTEGRVADTVTTGKADWRVFLDNSYFLKSTEITCYLGAITEDIDFRRTPARWKEPDFDASSWRKAVPACSVPPTDSLNRAGVLQRFRMREREIPLLDETEAAFVSCFSLADGTSLPLLETGECTVRPEETYEVVLDAGRIQNGYPHYIFEGGPGVEVSITYFEKFGGPGSDLRRTDWKNGAVIGLEDHLVLAGGPLVYEPFWYRCFRFIRIRISAGSEPVRMKAPGFRRTGYPLRAESFVRSSVPWVEKLWTMCVHTLENCMMETYMDCPYHEQLQFAMDTRLEALYTYTVTRDSRLAKKALIDFHYGMQPEGLTAGKYPSAYIQILSSFSLHYIFMLQEYAQQAGDPETIRTCLCDVDRILDYYGRRIGQDGLLGRLDFWEFVDWQEAWLPTGGMPAALMYGPSTILNLMYAYALRCGEDLFRRAGRGGIAEEYAQRRAALLARIRESCYDPEKGLYREGPACEQITQHAQAWAVLNGLASGKEAGALLQRALQDPGCLRVTFSTAYEWFRALEEAGMYGQIRKDMEDWIRLLDLDCTACPETPAHARSDCHAWSALPMFALIRHFAGIREQADGTLRIVPYLADLPDLEGQAVTSQGTVRFAYRKNAAGELNADVSLPEGVHAEICFPDGRRVLL